MRNTKCPASEVWMTSAFLMFAWSSCITRCSTRCEPVRCTSTLMPGYAASNCLATFSALGRTSEVYQTTLPSFFAASTSFASGAASAGPATTSESSTATSRRIMGGSPPR